MGLQLGVYLPTWPPAGRPPRRWPELRALARQVEAAGIDHLWVADEPGFWEGWTMLSAVAEATERIGVGPLIACTRYRNPALLVTMIRALDEVAAGRVVVGLGAGASPTDPRLAAFGFPSGPPHVARFAEAVEIIVRLLRDGSAQLDGQFHQVRDPDLGPAGPRPGGPPIWVAAGKPRAMAVAARWADAVNGADGITAAASVATLRQLAADACAEVGRDPETLRLTGWARLAISADGRRDFERADTISGTVTQVGDALESIAEAGLDHLTWFVGEDDDHHAYPALTERALERFAPVGERLRASKEDA